MTAITRTLRPCPLCGNPTQIETRLETHVGPTKRHPRADVVLWLCPACALAVTGPNRGGRRR